MSIYYLNNSGTNVYPYSNPNSGATNFNTLNTNVTFQDGDIIRFVASGGIIDDTDITIGTNATSNDGILANLTFEKYDDVTDDTNPNPIWELGLAPHIYFYKNNIDITFDGIDFHFGNSVTDVYILTFYNKINSLTIQNCKIESDVDCIYTNFIVFGSNLIDKSANNITISNNDIYNISNVIISYTNISNVNINNNNFVNKNSFGYVIGTMLFLNNPLLDIDFDTWNIYNNYCQSIYAMLYLTEDVVFPVISNVNIYNNKCDNSYAFIYTTNINMNTWNIYDNKITNVGEILSSNWNSSITCTITEDVSVTNLSIYDNNISGYIYGVYLSNSTGTGVFNNILIDNNNINSFIDSDTKIGISCSIMNSENITISNNIIDFTDSGNVNADIGISLDGNDNNCINLDISNNIIIESNNTSIFFTPTTYDLIQNVNITHNNFVSIDTSASSGILFLLTTTTLLKSVNITDNIFYGENTTTEINVKSLDATTSIIDYNSFSVMPTITFSNNITGSLSTSGTNNIIADPRWIDVDTLDFYLKQDSPCINAGTLNSDIGAIPYVDGVNVYVQDSVITNFNNTTNETVVLRLENNALDNDTRDQFNIIKDNDNQFDFIPPINYPLLKDNIGYDEDLTWLINNKSELAPFPDVDSPPNPGKAYPQFTDYPYGIYGFRRSDGK